MRAPELAEELQVSTRTVQRWFQEAGVPPCRKRLTGEQAAWADRAAAEGVPWSWIAETVGFSRDAIYKRMREKRIHVDSNWKSIQLAIRHDPALSLLHEEFAP